ncbi:MAG: uroporphyrinogen decarboxylase [Clostridiales bacterium]|nr:uroporphyrinogen decarboxylase [Clostridiales bacterium]
MSNVAELFAERSAIREDLFSGKRPKRVPVYPNFTLEAACGLAGVSLLEAHYDPELEFKAHDKICETFYSDSMASLNLRYPPVYQLLGAKNWILASNGVVQHPEIETMFPEDYDAFIESPYDTIMEVFLPRVCSALDTDPINSATVFAKAFQEWTVREAGRMGTIGALSQKYGYSAGTVTAPMTEAPFDFLADQLRGFKGILMDCRRMPDKVEAACKAVLPHMIKVATPLHPYPGMQGFIPLHLAPYMNPQQFEKLWWPTFEELVIEMDKRNIGATIFAENDWTRFLDYLTRLPKSTVAWVEDGDMKKYTETFGKDHVFGGFFDPTITLTKSKEECIDVVKEMCEICMKSDHFFFAFNKGVMDIKSIDVGKLQAVLEWVRDNAHY